MIRRLIPRIGKDVSSQSQLGKVEEQGSQLISEVFLPHIVFQVGFNRVTLSSCEGRWEVN